jgi:hypothetical protein
MAATVTTVLPFAEIGLGGLLLLKGKPSLLKTAAGGILAGAGIKAALKKFGVISGYQSVPVIGGKRIRGYQSVPVIGAYDQASPSVAQLAGQNEPGANTPAALKGYGVNGLVPGYQPNGSGVMGSLYANADNGSGLSHNYSGMMES